MIYLKLSNRIVGVLNSFNNLFNKRAISNLTTTIPMNPINDLLKFKVNYSRNEQITRCKLASLYRLVHLNNWTSGIYNHITAALRDKTDDRLTNFLINPFGLLYSEVTASSLVKVDDKCNIIDQGTTKYGVNKAGFVLHSAIHSARPDINYIIHVHTKSAAAISTLKHGLLPISQEALICGDISYHSYSGILVDENSKKQLVEDLGPKNKIMILRNHGVVICGETVEETWHFLYNFMYACDIQACVSNVSLNNQIIIANDEIRKQVSDVTKVGGGGVNVTSQENTSQWKLGELEFEAMMRLLDSMGLLTGYPYKAFQLKPK